MIIVTKDIYIQQEKFTLTNQRALYWERENTLVVSDLHIGKTAHFRKAGIAIPSTILDNDLLRLQLLIDHFKVQTVLVVGDLFHAGKNIEIDHFQNFMLHNKTIGFELIKGNHDRLKDSFYESIGITIFKTHKDVHDFRFVHDEKHCETQKFCVSGHTHPGVSIKGKGKVRIKLPCFEVSEYRLILPAFSEFTGLNTKRTIEASVCYGFTKNSVFEL